MAPAEPFASCLLAPDVSLIRISSFSTGTRTAGRSGLKHPWILLSQPPRQSRVTKLSIMEWVVCYAHPSGACEMFPVVQAYIVRSLVSIVDLQ